MRPETWETIRRDWRESLPSVISGTDDKFYPDGWAVANAAPRSAKTTLRYLCWSMGWDCDEIRSRRRLKRLSRQREALAVVLQRRFANQTHARVGEAMNRERSAFGSLVNRGCARERESPEFADLVKRLECLI